MPAPAPAPPAGTPAPGAPAPAAAPAPGGAPAPGRGPAPVTPPAGPQRSAIGKATDALRARVAEGRGIVDAPAASPAPPAPAPAAPPAPEAPAAPAAPPAPDPAPAPPAPEPPAPPAQPRDERGRFAPAEAAPGEAPAGEGESASTFDLAFPGRRPGEPDRIYQTDDPQLFEDFQRLRNGYARTEALEAERAQVRTERDQYEELRELVTLDPVGFVSAHLPPEESVEVALGILLNERVWPGAQRVLRGLLSDRNAPLVARSRLEADSYRRRDEAQQRITAERQERELGRQMRGMVQRLLPADIPSQNRDGMHQHLLATLAQHAQRYGPPRDADALMLALAPSLRQLGIDPLAAQARLQAPPSPPGHARVRPVAAGAAPAPGNPPPGGQQTFPAARTLAGAAAPPGAGAGSSTMPPVPKGTKVRDAANLLRQRYGLPQKG